MPLPRLPRVPRFFAATLLALAFLALAVAPCPGAGFALYEGSDDRSISVTDEEQARIDAEPVALVDGETAVTKGELRRCLSEMAAACGGHLPVGWQDAAIKECVTVFLLGREARRRGFASGEELVLDGWTEPTEDELRARWKLLSNLRDPPVFEEASVTVSSVLVICPEDADEEKKAAAQARIRKLRDRVVSGESVTVVAREASDDPSAKFNGGEYTFGPGVMVPEFEKAAFTQPVGEIGEPFHSVFGWFFLVVSSRSEPRLKSFEEARAEVAEELKRTKMNEIRDQLVEPLREKAKIEILSWNPLDSLLDR